MKEAGTISASVEDYLTAIYRLTPAGKPVGPARLAEFMGLSAPSITIMIKRLSEQGLVVKDNARGVALSDQGENLALSVLRRHRLAECFLVNILGIDWALAHVEAHRFEHAFSDVVTDALERFLGYPKACPHGNPIPDRQGNVPESDVVPLSVMLPPALARVACVDDRDTSILCWLAGVGLVPGVEVRVEQVDPSGAVLLRVGDRSVAAGPEIVMNVLVRKVETSVYA